MSIFSDLLSRLFEEKGISRNYISSYIAVDRTILYRYIQGKALPSRERLNKMCVAMGLSPVLRSELFEAYEISEIGDELYEQRKIVRQIITDLPNSLHQRYIQPKYKPLNMDDSVGDCEIILGRANINTKIKLMFDYQINEEKYSPLRLLIQPDCQYIFDLLLATPFEYRKRLNVIHCVRFQEQNNSASVQKKHINLEFLKSIIPLLFSSQTDNTLFYQPYYYYDNNINSNMRVMEIMPNLIVNDLYAIVISYDFERALFFSNKDIIKFYVNEFTRILGNSEPLFKKFNNELEISSFLYKIETEHKIFSGEIKSDPCIFSFVPIDFIDKKVKADMPNRDLVINITKERQKIALENIKNGIEYNEYFDESGINKLIETGYISDIPNEFVDPLDKDEIIIMLDYIIDMMNKYENFHSLLLQPGKLDIFKNGVYIFIHRDYGVVFGCNSTELRQTTLYLITEKAITNAFNDFFSYFKNDHTYVKTKQETIDYLQSKVDELKQINVALTY